MTTRVHACRMTPTTFSYFCKFCPHIHTHGNNGDYCNHRTEHRASHCLNRTPLTSNVEITIDSRTKRYVETAHNRATYRRHCARLRRQEHTIVIHHLEEIPDVMLDAYD